MLEVYEEIPPELLELVEDVLLNRRPDATERLVEFGEKLKCRRLARKPLRRRSEEWRKGTVEERLTHALVKGIDAFIDADTEEARAEIGKPLARHRRPAHGRHERRRRSLWRGQNVSAAGREIRARDEEGRRLSAAVHGGGESRELAAGGEVRAQGKVLMATVKGDVHDIGKNIVGVVLGCNNYEVIDLGVMVPCEKILETARERKRRCHRPERPDHAVARRDGRMSRARWSAPG